MKSANKQESRTLLRVTKYSFIVPLFFMLGIVGASELFPTLGITLNEKQYTLELADNQARKSQGLMFRRYLPENRGMLFVYDQPIDLKIWMKNTLIPLTVVWLDDNAVIIDKKILFPCKSTHCPVFGPEQKSRYALEFNAAEFPRFKIGQRLSAISEWHANL